MDRRAMLAGLASAGAGFAGPAAADPPDLRSGIVIVIAKGFDANSQPRYATSTGFIISKQGFLVTTYHALKALGAEDNPSEIEWSVFFSKFSTEAFPAGIIAELKNVDLLVLAAKIQSQKYTPLRLHGGNRPVEAVTPIFTSGYAGDEDYKIQRGYVTSLAGSINPTSFAWTTDIPFKAGQSGSPVYLENGHVVAVVKASDQTSPSVGFVVPSQLVPNYLWDTFNTPASADTLGAAGNVTLTGEIDAQPRLRTKALSATNQACQGFASHVVKFDAAPGWMIDPQSITPEKQDAMGDTTVTVENVEATSFEVWIGLKNVGGCPVLPGTGAKQTDTIARYDGIVRYREIPQAGTKSRVALVSAPLVAGLNLPVTDPTATNLRFDVVTSSGAEKQLPASAGIVRQIRGVPEFSGRSIIQAATRF